MATIRTTYKYKCDLDKGTLETSLRNSLMQADALADAFAVTVQRNGADVDISGMTVYGYLYASATKTTVPLKGTISGSTATVILSEDCYTVPGYASLMIQLHDGDVRHTVLKVDFVVTRTGGTLVLDGDNILPTLAELLGQISAMEQATAEAREAAAAADAAREGIQGDLAALTEDIKQSGLSNVVDFSTSIAGECIYFNGALLQDRPIFSRVEFDIKAGSTIIASVAQSALNTAVFAQKIGGGYIPLVISDNHEQAEYKYTTNDDMTICLTYRNDKEHSALVRIEPKQLSEVTSDNATALMEYSRTGEMPITADFVRGKVNIYGFYWDVTNRIRSAHVIKIINSTTIKARDGFRFAVVSFADGAIANDSGWQTEYTIPAGSEVVLNIARSNEDETEIADVEYFSAQVYIASTRALELEKRMGKAWPEIPSLCRCVCHRGYTTTADPETGAPENTLSAIRLAYENGFRYVEIDVTETLDGEIVLMHDDSINRTCLNADGSEIVNVVNVSETNYSDLLKYTANRQAPAFTDKIPTLKQALALAKKLGVHLYIELKNNNTSSGVATIVDNVRKIGMTRHVSYVSFFWEKLGIVSDITTDSRLGFLTNGYDIDDNILVPVRTHATSKGAKAFIDFGVSFDGLTDESSALTEKGMQNAMEADVELEVYVLNTENLVDKYLGTYITGITTDGYNPFK